MTFELISCSATATPPPSATNWVNSATSGGDGLSIASTIADGITQGFARVGEWMLDGIGNGLIWIATKVAPIVTIASEGAIVLCLFIYVMTGDKKYSSALLKWVIIFFISIAIVGGF